MKEFFLIGEIVKPQGIGGEVKIKPHTQNLKNLLKNTVFYFFEKDDYVQKAILSVREYDQFLYIHFADVTSRNAAESLRGKEIYIHRSQGAPLKDEEHYIVDLVGCSVLNSKKEKIGELVDVLQPGGTDVYVVKTPKGNIMFPALLKLIPEVNIEEKWIKINENILEEVGIFEH